MHHGCNLRDALRVARRLGCAITRPRRTGDLLIRPPCAELHPVRVNARRKDSPRALTSLIKVLTRSPGEEGAMVK